MTACTPEERQPRIADALEEGERVGLFEFRVEAAEDCDEVASRWTRRAEVLAAWLVAEWERERRKEGAS